MIALAGGGLALVITAWTARTLSYFLPATTLPLTLNGHVDGSVMLATLLVSVLTAAFSGIIPALRASSLSPVAVLKDEALSTSGGLSKSRLTSSLVVAQIALSLLLLTCAGLFIRSLQNARNSAPGFDPNHVLLTSFDLDPMGYTGAQGIEFDRQILARVRQLPGVQSATMADFSPLSFTIHSDGVSLRDICQGRTSQWKRIAPGWIPAILRRCAPRCWRDATLLTGTIRTPKEWL